MVVLLKEECKDYPRCIIIFFSVKGQDSMSRNQLYHWNMYFSNWLSYESNSKLTEGQTTQDSVSN